MADKAVSDSRHCLVSMLADERIFARFAPLLYTAEGEEIIERLWQETLDEFAFADVRDVLQSMKAQ